MGTKRTLVGGAMAAAVGLGAIMVAAVPSTADHTAKAKLIDTNGNPAGTVKFSAGKTKNVVNVHIRIPREFEGFHGFHVHAAGVCDPNAVDATGARSPFFTAGGHYSATPQGHRSHDGDMPLVMILGDGTATLTFPTDRLALSELL